MFTVKGKVTDRSGDPVWDAKVYASLADGSEAKDQQGNKIAITRPDTDGNFTLHIPMLQVGGIPTVPVAGYVTAKTGTRIETLSINSGNRNLDFVLGSGASQEVDEVTVVGTRPKEVNDPAPAKKFDWKWLLIGGGALVVLTTIIAVATKKKKK
jgi:hypothetical protein